MRIRPRAEADVDACLALLHELHESDGYPPVWPEDPRAFLVHSRQLATWVVEDGGAVIGHISLHRAPGDQVAQPASDACGTPVEDLAVVARLMVAPGARRRGLGRVLLATATAEAHRRGLRPVLDTMDGEYPSVALYEAMGWTRAGPYRLRFRSGESISALIFLGPPPGLAEDISARVRPALEATGTAGLRVDDFSVADVPLWSGHPSSARSLGVALARRANGEVDYLAVRGPGGEALAKGGIDYLQEPGAGVIYQLDVLAPLQGLGLGTRLVEEAERRIRARGLTTAMLGVEDDNPRARSLYERLGYRFVKREHESWEHIDPAGYNRLYETWCAILTKPV